MKKIIKIVSFMVVSLIAVISMSFLGNNNAQPEKEADASNEAVFNPEALENQEVLGVAKGKLEKIYMDMYIRYPEATNSLVINEIKEMNDLNGNEYSLVEFAPIGYAIYTDNYSTMLEISAKAPSPYLNENDDLLYFGALNYYVKDNDSVVYKFDSLRHTVKDTKINLSETNMEKLENISEEMSNNIVRNKKMKTRLNKELNEWSNSGSSYETASVKNTSIISGANTSGFNTDGNCGFVAGSILVYYAAKAWGWTYLYSGDKLENSLVVEIQDGHGNSTCAPDLEKKLNDFLNKKGSTRKAKVNMWHIPAAHSIYDRVKEDKPVAIFGSLTDVADSGKCNHAVVVYEVRRHVNKGWFGIKTYNDYEYRTHYGWGEEYNDVIISHDSIYIGGMVNLHK